MKTKVIVAVLLAWCVLFGAAGHAQAAEFYAIIANLNNANNPQAQIDVSVDTRSLANGPIAIPFDVFRQDGSILTSFDVLVDPHGLGFASSSFAAFPDDNLFTVSEGLPVLVRISVPQSVTSSAAILRQTLGKSAIVLNVLPARRQDGTSIAVGRLFPVAIGEIANSATLLIANVSGADVNVDVFLGTPGAPGSGKYNNPRLQNREVWILDLDQSDANSHLLVISNGDIIVQLAVDEGKKHTVTEVTLLPN